MPVTQEGTDPRRGAWKALAATGLGIASLIGFGYAGWVMTLRRGIFAAIAETAETSSGGAPSGGATETVPPAVAHNSDALNAGWLWATTVLIVIALALWVGARLIVRVRFGPIGFAGLALVAVGVFVVFAGSFVASLTDGDPTQAGRAVLGYAVIGGGFLLTSSGLLAGLVSLFREQPGDQTPQLGYAGWISG